MIAPRLLLPSCSCRSLSSPSRSPVTPPVAPPVAPAAPLSRPQSLLPLPVTLPSRSSPSAPRQLPQSAHAPSQLPVSSPSAPRQLPSQLPASFPSHAPSQLPVSPPSRSCRSQSRYPVAPAVHSNPATMIVPLLHRRTIPARPPYPPSNDVVTETSSLQLLVYFARPPTDDGPHRYINFAPGHSTLPRRPAAREDFLQPGRVAKLLSA